MAGACARTVQFLQVRLALARDPLPEKRLLLRRSLNWRDGRVPNPAIVRRSTPSLPTALSSLPLAGLHLQGNRLQGSPMNTLLTDNEIVRPGKHIHRDQWEVFRPLYF